jgi:hypothetical protein
MLQNTSSNSIGAGLPDEGEVAFARVLAANANAALGNHTQSSATVVAATAVPYIAMTSTAIARKSSGIFQIAFVITIGDNGGSLVDTDAVSIQLSTGIVAGAGLIGPVISGGASTMAGGLGGLGKGLTLSGVFTHNPAIAVGNTQAYSVQVTFANAHTSGIAAITQGNIDVFEFPG